MLKTDVNRVSCVRREKTENIKTVLISCSDLFNVIPLIFDFYSGRSFFKRGIKRSEPAQSLMVAHAKIPIGAFFVRQPIVH